MRRWIVLFLIAMTVFLAAAFPAQQNPLEISQMEINIWPEYDQLETLVIFRISFSSMTSFPAKVSVRIPSSAGDPYMVAMKDLDGLLYDLEYTTIIDGNWNRIEFVTSSPDLQIEFYDPITIGNDINHTYTFHWVSDYAIQSLKVIVQKPKFATTMTIQPDLGTGVVNPDDGLTYYSSDVGNVSQGLVVNLKLSYLKTNDALSASTMPVKAVNPISSQGSVWQLIVGIIKPVWENHSLVVTGSLLLGGVLLFLFVSILTSTHKRPSNPNTGVPKLVKRKNRVIVTETPAEIYCHQCGKRARLADVYCRVCGSKLTRG